MSSLLRELALLRQSLARIEFEAVQVVRRTGVTWEAIGEELGISRQAARSRFGEPRQRRPEPAANSSGSEAGH